MEPGKKTCPSCRTELAEKAVLCVGCGYHLERGEHLKTRSQRFHRQWDFGLTVAAQAGAVVLAFLAAGGCAVFYWPWGLAAFVLALVLLFVVGMFGRRVVLERTPKGNVRLTVVQWVLFRPTVTSEADLEKYEAAYSSFLNAGKYTSYLIEVRGPGVPTILVYDGGSHAVMKEMLDCLQFEAGLPIRRGDDL
jgi:hypothetical protein